MLESGWHFPMRRLRFGAVVVEWDARHEFPIALDHERPGWFVTKCDIIYRYGVGEYKLRVDARFRFDGASTPWFVRIIPGLGKLDWHLMATLPHDFVCEHPELLSRPVGDGIFLTVLLAIAETQFAGGERKRKQWTAWAMYLGVWVWTIWQAVKGVPIKQSKVPPLDELSTTTYATYRRGEAGDPRSGGSGSLAGGSGPYV